MNLPGTVLLLEPDVALNRSVHAHLETRGHLVLDGDSHASLHDLAVATHPDVLLVDVDDRKALSSLAVIDLQQDDRTADLPVVLIGESQNGWSSRFEQIHKPLDASVLVNRIETTVELHRLRQEMRTIRHSSDGGDYIDSLTGLNGARRLRDELAHNTAAVNRYGGTLSIALFDLDRFESTNHVHGNNAGDDVLREVAQRLAADVRSSDIVGRWRADQFMAILPSTDVDGAAFFAERFRQLLCEVPVITTDGRCIGVTASFGVVQGTDEIELVQSAEAAIGTAKRHGRNRVMAVGKAARSIA